MIKFIATIAACAMLAACATPDVIYQPVPVQTMVTVPCRIPAVATPAMPTDGITPKNSLFEQVRALMAENEVRRGYEGILLASVKACQ